jgi:hypothetical protein
MADLASLVHQPPSPQIPIRVPAPTHAQTVALFHRLQETKRLMGNILKDPKAGHANIRPLLLDAGAKLIGDRLQSVAEFMGGIADFPAADDPLAQKQWIRRLYEISAAGQRKLLEHHRAAHAPDGTMGEPWAADSHADHVTAGMAHYR